MNDPVRLGSLLGLASPADQRSIVVVETTPTGRPMKLYVGTPEAAARADYTFSGFFSRFARLLQPFGCTVLACDINDYADFYAEQRVTRRRSTGSAPTAC
jgi:hypothetical protein